MATKKKIKYIMFFLIVINIINFCSCSKEIKNKAFSNSINEVLKNVTVSDDYKKYVEITMKEPTELLESVKDDKGNEVADKCYISENLIFKNISDKEFSFNVKIFLTKEFSGTIAQAPTSFGLNNEIKLAPGKSADVAAAIIMKKINKFTEKEKMIYDNYSRKVFVELIIDNKYYCFEQETTT